MDERHLTFEEVAEAMQETVRAVGRSFTDPDEDWMPILEAFPQEGGSFVFGFDPEFLSSEAAKDLLAERIMVPAIRGCGAKIIATVFSAWSARIPKEEVDGDGNFSGKMPSERPDREEIVILTIMDSTRVVGYSCNIIRDGKTPPTLADEWQRWEGNLGGRFVEPLQDALRDSSGRPSPDFMEQLKAIGAQEI